MNIVDPRYDNWRNEQRAMVFMEALKNHDPTKYSRNLSEYIDFVLAKFDLNFPERKP